MIGLGEIVVGGTLVVPFTGRDLAQVEDERPLPQGISRRHSSAGLRKTSR